MLKSCVGCNNFVIAGTTDQLNCTKQTPNPFIRLHHIQDAKEFRSQVGRAETCQKYDPVETSAARTAL